MSASGNDHHTQEYRFECQRCGYCCTHEPGYVFLSRLDLDNLTSYLNMKEEDFIARFCVVAHFGWESRLSLREKSNHDCIFWKAGEGCTVYPVRPVQCRTYPVWPGIIANQKSWDEEALKCPGMNKGAILTDSEIQERLTLRENNPLLYVKQEK